MLKKKQLLAVVLLCVLLFVSVYIFSVILYIMYLTSERLCEPFHQEAV